MTVKIKIVMCAKEVKDNIFFCVCQEVYEARTYVLNFFHYFYFFRNYSANAFYYGKTDICFLN